MTVLKFKCIVCNRRKLRKNFWERTRICQKCHREQLRKLPLYVEQESKKEELSPLEGYGYVYAIENPYTKLVKIGYTQDLQRRMKGYASHAGYYMTLLAFTKGSREDEAKIIRKMQPHRIIFDWVKKNEIFDEFVHKYPNKQETNAGIVRNWDDIY